MVAGVLATFLAYEKVPFDTSDGQVASAAKKYLMDIARWNRQPNMPVIWNGVTEADNPPKEKAISSSSTPRSTPTVAPATSPTSLQCNLNPTGAVKDSHENAVKNVAHWFCDLLPTENVSSRTISYELSGFADDIGDVQHYQGSKNIDDVYSVTVDSVDGCKSEGGFNVVKPIPKYECADLLHVAWKNCEWYLFSGKCRNESH